MKLRPACILAAILLVGCTGDDGEPTDPSTCSTGRPDAVIEVSVTGAVSVTDTFEIACGVDVEAPWGVFAQNTRPSEGEDQIFQINLSYGQDWGANMHYASAEPLADGGSYGIAETGGVFSLPLGPGGERSASASGGASIAQVEEADGPLRTVLVDGEADITYEDGTAVEIVFSALPVMEAEAAE